MSQNHNYRASALYALINSGTIRLPLSHTRALEVIAHLEGASDWNVVSIRDDVPLLKARAIILRESVNVNLRESALSLEAAQFCIDQTMRATAEETGAAAGGSGKSNKFEWPKPGKSVETTIAELPFKLSENIIEMRMVRFLRLAAHAAILAPIGVKPTKKALTQWMSDCQATFASLMSVGIFPVLGDPGAIDNYSPLRFEKLSKASRDIAQQLMSDYAIYCGTVRSNLAGTLGAFANTIERLPKNLAREHMATFLHVFNNQDELRHHGRDINFVLNADNRAVAGRIARLAIGLGLEEDATAIAEFERETELVKEIREKFTRAGVRSL